MLAKPKQNLLSYLRLGDSCFEDDQPAHVQLEFQDLDLLQNSKS